MAKLGVNIDHVATLRQVRLGIEPKPLDAALICESAGADSIVVHLREDRRHINDQDLYLLKKSVTKKLNLEMSVAPEIVEIACRTRPDQVTLVPERRKEITTEGGLDVAANLKKVGQAAEKLKKKDIEVSLFIDPEKKQIEAAKKIGIKMIELHTGRYAQAKDERQINGSFNELVKAARLALDNGFTVNAGHGLNYYNAAMISRIRGIEELNIGYSIVCRAVLVGLDKAVRQMIAVIRGAGK